MFVFRAIEADDIKALLKLYQSAGITGPKAFSVTQAQQHLEHLKRYPAYTVWGVFSDGLLVGTYELLIMDNMAKAGAKSAIVEDVAVDPACQRQGVGRQMMAHAYQQARKAQCYKLVLSSNIHREAAHRFYERLGFVQHGISFQVALDRPGL